jgi:fucose permease
MKSKILKAEITANSSFDISKNLKNNTTLNEEELESINEYLIAEKPYRFIVITVASLTNFASGYQWNNISSISKDFQIYYNLSSLHTYLFSNMYMFMYIIMTIPSFYLIEKKSLKLAVIIMILL